MRFISEFWREPDIQVGALYMVVGNYGAGSEPSYAPLLNMDIFLYRGINPTFNLIEK